MPITREEFAGGLDKGLIKIVTILAKSPDHAFTDKEVAEKAQVDNKTAFLILQDLKQTGYIVGKSISGQYYYTVSDEVAMQIKSGNFEMPTEEEIMDILKGNAPGEDDNTRYIG
ncbi:MAG: hypothetical protein HY367_03455 [Candidatus Aenigmarchaeota archaeon]|nr:hypothetical protein [Candidatus Aenigmarchaeota archaeon]